MKNFLSVVECQMNAHILNELAGRFYPRRFVFVRFMAVKTHRYPRARFAYDFLLDFVSEKFVCIIVYLEIMHAVVVYVQFPENARLRHFPKISIGVFSPFLNKCEYVGMRNPHGATATLGEIENIPVRDRGGVVEVFNQRKIEKGNPSDTAW